jgi:hypothetical protein
MIGNKSARPPRYDLAHHEQASANRRSSSKRRASHSSGVMARPKILPPNQVIGTKDGVSLEGDKLEVLTRAGVGWRPQPAGPRSAESLPVMVVQGTWTATKAERDGQAVDDVVGHRLSFTGNRFQILSRDGKPSTRQPSG